MKTWWDYYPMMILAVLIPLLVTGLPTVVIRGDWVGGGYAREYLLNTVASFLPSASADLVVEKFATASVLGEYLLVLPITLNISAVLAVIIFVVFSLVMRFANWMKRSEFRSQRKASKGA